MRKLIFVKTPNAMLVGKWTGETPVVLENPRIVFNNQGDNSIQLSEFIGNPKDMTIGKIDYWYENRDANFEKFYIENVTGLKMPGGPGLNIVK